VLPSGQLPRDRDDVLVDVQRCPHIYDVIASPHQVAPAHLGRNRPSVRLDPSGAHRSAPQPNEATERSVVPRCGSSTRGAIRPASPPSPLGGRRRLKPTEGADASVLGASAEELRGFALDGLTRRLNIIGVPIDTL
jgi:hypothetical protein